MPELAVGLESLAAVILFAVALGLALTGKYLATAVASPVASVLRLIPSFGGSLADGLESGVESLIIEPLNEVASDAEAGIAQGFAGILAALELGLGLTILLADGVRAALTYLWNHALVPLVHSITDAIQTAAHKALALAEAVPGQITDAVADATSAAEGLATRDIAAVETVLRDEIRAASAAANDFANDAVAKLSAVEDAAISTVDSLIRSTAEAEQDAVAAALAGVKAIAVGADLGITDLKKYIDSLGLAGTIAGSLSLATLVTLVLTETGLDNASCRGKVKNICQTDATLFANLLAGLAVVGFAFSLDDLYAVARPLVGDLATVIEQAA